MRASSFVARGLLVLGLFVGASALADEAYNVTINEGPIVPGAPIALSITCDPMVVGHVMTIYEGSLKVGCIVLAPEGNNLTVPNAGGVTSAVGPGISARIVMPQGE